MYSYTIKRMFDTEEFNFKSDTQTLSIRDPRFLYKCIRSPLKNGSIEDVVKSYPPQKEYLHRKLDKHNFHNITFFEKHKDDVVFKTDNGEKLTVKDFWQPCINDVHITFLKQLTLQISKFLLQKIPSCINENTSISFYDHFCIKDNGYSYSIISLAPLEIPDNFLEVFSIIIIKWKSKSPKFEYIETYQEVDESLIEFTFCSYDEEVSFCNTYFKHSPEIAGMLERLSECINSQRNEKTTDLHNYIDICDLNELSNLKNYPDVVLKFIFEREVNKETVAQTKSAILEFINKYNSKNTEKIHDAFCISNQEIKVSEENDSLLFVVDFANSKPEALFKLVAFLENSSLNILKILIRAD